MGYILCQSITVEVIFSSLTAPRARASEGGGGAVSTPSNVIVCPTLEQVKESNRTVSSYQVEDITYSKEVSCSKPCIQNVKNHQVPGLQRGEDIVKESKASHLQCKPDPAPGKKFKKRNK